MDWGGFGQDGLGLRLGVCGGQGISARVPEHPNTMAVDSSTDSGGEEIPVGGVTCRNERTIYRGAVVSFGGFERALKRILEAK